MTGGDSPTWPPWVEGVVIMSHLALGGDGDEDDDLAFGEDYQW